MTHHTDAELLPCPFCGDHAETDFIPEHHSYAIECHSIGCAARVIKETAEDAVEAWNRRAPVVKVPQGCKPVPVELLERIQESLGLFVSDQGWSQSDMDTADALDGLLAAAPQPPEAAPVQLPEPAATVLSKLGTTCMFPSAEISKGTNLYTEHQVRQLLAANCIK